MIDRSSIVTGHMSEDQLIAQELLVYCECLIELMKVIMRLWVGAHRYDLIKSRNCDWMELMYCSNL